MQSGRTYYRMGGGTVAQRERPLGMGNGTPFWLHGDHLGGATLTTTTSGAKQNGQEYGPWGNLRSGDLPETTLDFTGQRRDDTGLLYYGARYYDPLLGRFLSADTEGVRKSDPQSLNRYSYVGNNPTNRTDPTGHDYLGGGAGTYGYGIQYTYNMGNNIYNSTQFQFSGPMIGPYSPLPGTPKQQIDYSAYPGTAFMPANPFATPEELDHDYVIWIIQRSNPGVFSGGVSYQYYDPSTGATIGEPEFDLLNFGNGDAIEIKSQGQGGLRAYRQLRGNIEKVGGTIPSSNPPVGINFAPRNAYNIPAVLTTYPESNPYTGNTISYQQTQEGVVLYKAERSQPIVPVVPGRLPPTEVPDRVRICVTNGMLVRC